MGNLNDNKDINCALENIKEKIKTSAKDTVVLYELKQHTPWFDEEYLRYLDQRMQVKMQWLQDPNQSNVDNVNIVRFEANRYLRNKKEELRQNT